MATRCCSPPLNSRRAVFEAALDRQQIAEVIEVLEVEGLFAAAHGPRRSDVAHGGKGGQEVKFLENKADTVLAQAGALGVAEGGESRRR